MKEGVVRVDAERLKAVMRERKMSAVALAEKMQMHANGIQRIKSTGSTNLGTLEKMCNILNCHPFDLLVAEGYPEPFCLAPASH